MHKYHHFFFVTQTDLIPADFLRSAIGLSNENLQNIPLYIAQYAEGNPIGVWPGLTVRNQTRLGKWVGVPYTGR